MSNRNLMDIELKDFNIESILYEYRNIVFSDFEEIGKLDLLTIKDTVEYSGETQDESIEEIKDTLQGKYGEFLKDSSFVVIDNDVIIASVICVFSIHENKPLIAYVMTHPDYQRKGICRFLIMKSLHSLYSIGYGKAYLAVHPNNFSALATYVKLGFKIREKLS